MAISLFPFKTSTAAKPQSRSWGQKATCILVLLGLWGCKAFDSTSTTPWKTYSNQRYGFEFLYPSNWIELPSPENNDGSAFVSPEKKSLSIRGWAGNQLQTPISEDKTAKRISNFKTNQGVSGVLVVEIGREISTMTLIISGKQVKYYWQGQSASQDFDNYYRFFYYIAQQYRILKQK
jgi:hypothetical protein